MCGAMKEKRRTMARAPRKGRGGEAVAEGQATPAPPPTTYLPQRLKDQLVDRVVATIDIGALSAAVGKSVAARLTEGIELAALTEAVMERLAGEIAGSEAATRAVERGLVERLADQ